MSITLVGRFGIPGWRVSQVFVKQPTPPERKLWWTKNLPQLGPKICVRKSSGTVQERNLDFSFRATSL